MDIYIILHLILEAIYVNRLKVHRRQNSIWEKGKERRVWKGKITVGPIERKSSDSSENQDKRRPDLVRMVCCKSG